jgi:hypothetical protein
MLKVTRSRLVAAASGAVWDVVSDVGRLPDWLTPVEAAEILEGDGADRVQRIHTHWGDRQSEIDQRVTEWEPPRRLAWVHEAERLDGRPAPRLARWTRFEIRLDARPGGIQVTLESIQVSDSALKGLALRLAGRRRLAGAYESSLQRLDELVTASRV